MLHHRVLLLVLAPLPLQCALIHLVEQTLLVMGKIFVKMMILLFYPPLVYQRRILPVQH